MDSKIKIIWIGSRPSIDLVKRSYPNVECVDVNRLDFKDFKNLSNKVDVFLDLQRKLKISIWLRFLGLSFGFKTVVCRKRYLTRQYLVWLGTWPMLRKFFPKVRVVKQLELIAISVNRALHLLGYGASTDENPFLGLGSRKLGGQGSLIPWIGIAPGASFPTKAMPVEKWLSLLFALKKRFGNGYGLRFFGDKNDAHVVKDLKSKFAWPMDIEDYSGKTSLVETGQLLSECKVLIGNDSGTAHLAEALGVPVVIGFGPTVLEFGFGPFMQKSSSLSEPLECRPCSKHGQKDCRFKTKKCFLEIADQRFVDGVEKALT